MTGCGVAEKPSVSMMGVVSSSTDGAARATSRAFGEREKEELEEVQRIVNEGVENCPEKYREAVTSYIALTEEQRDAADEFHELGCSGHALNLTVDDSWKQSEKAAVLSNMARDRAATTIKRSWALWKLGKKLPSGRAKSESFWLLAWKSKSRQRVEHQGGMSFAPLPAGKHLDGSSELPTSPISSCACANPTLPRASTGITTSTSTGVSKDMPTARRWPCGGS